MCVMMPRLPGVKRRLEKIYYYFILVFILILDKNNNNYKLIKEDHSCDDAFTFGGEKTLEECANTCKDLMFYFGKSFLCLGKNCPCYCTKGLPATKENCTFKARANYDVYAYRGLESVSTRESAPTNVTGHTL